MNCNAPTAPPCNPCEYGRNQDLPPAGGYFPIKYKRNAARTYLSGFQIFGIYGLVTGVSLYLYYLTSKKIQKHEIELRSNKMAIYPLLLAERDREYLRQCVRNREEEKKLMANVEGWEVGTYYGDKLFKTLKDEDGIDLWVDPNFHEYYVHCDSKDWYRRAYVKLRS